MRYDRESVPLCFLADSGAAFSMQIVRQNEFCSTLLFPEVQTLGVLMPCDYSWAYPVLLLSPMIDLSNFSLFVFVGFGLAEIFWRMELISLFCCLVGHCCC